MYKAKLLALFVTASILGCGEDSGPMASNMGGDPVGTWLDHDGDEWTFNSDGTFLKEEYVKNAFKIGLVWYKLGNKYGKNNVKVDLI